MEKNKKTSKKKKKNLEVVKNDEPQIKTEENLKKEKPKIGLCSYRLKEINVISDLFNNILKIKEKNKNVGGIIYENDIESNQAGIIDLGMALNFDYIILNGVNMSEQKITKIKAYIEELDNVSSLEKGEEEKEVKQEENKENIQENIKEEPVHEDEKSIKISNINSKVDINNK